MQKLESHSYSTGPLTLHMHRSMLQRAFSGSAKGGCKFKQHSIKAVKSVAYCRYGDAVIELDSGVGMILQKLKSLGIDKDTLVIFSSDNGGATYAKEQGRKLNQHEDKLF